jgi:predicted metal-dependent HD superfamily phosphohydrolase
VKETLSESHWTDLATRLHIADPVRVFRTLEVHYEERGRKYHTAHHINECLSELGRARHPEASNPLVEYALWFHDAVYNTFSSKNERRSADWAAHVLEKSGAPPATIETVRSLILATRHGEKPTDPAHQLLVDVDLAILGADADRFREFELQIRAEYWWVPTTLYRKQRCAILQSFVMRQSIYSTHEFRERYERLARNNIAWALEQLNFGTATFRWTARF